MDQENLLGWEDLVNRIERPYVKAFIFIIVQYHNNGLLQEEFYLMNTREKWHCYCLWEKNMKIKILKIIYMPLCFAISVATSAVSYHSSHCQRQSPCS